MYNKFINIYTIDFKALLCFLPFIHFYFQLLLVETNETLINQLVNQIKPYLVLC